MVGLERFEIVGELVEELFVLCWHRRLFHWMICINDNGDGHFPGL